MRLDILFVVALSPIFCLSFHHKCVHDELSTTHIYSSPVNYHPHALSRRQLLDGNDTWDYIRITPYWEQLEEDLQHNESLLQFAKQVVSASIRYFEDKIQVMPVSGNLILHRDCHFYFTDSNDEILSCINFTSTECFTIEMPENHFGDDYELHPYDGSYIKTYRGGGGIPDTDLIVYVTAQDDYCVGALAWASQCIRDQYGRPVAGVLNLCPDAIASVDWQVGVDVTTHELTHILIFSSSNWWEFRYENGSRRSVDEVLQYNGSHYYVITENVLQATQEHFDCEDAIGAALENSGSNSSAGSHWDERHFYSELMGAVSYADVVHVSQFTWALMQDSGWYQVSIDNHSEPFRMGYKRGCDFLNDDCFQNGTAVWPEFFCSDSEQYGCTYDGLGYGWCYMFEYEDIPDKHQWFDDELGGSAYADYCPFIQAFDDRQDVSSPYLCMDSNQSTPVNSVDIAFGVSNSRCIAGNLDSGSQTYGFCFEVFCSNYNSSSQEWELLTIDVDGTNITCARNESGVSKEVAGYTGSLQCPSIDLYCVGEKPFECFHGFWNEEREQCVCSAGFNGTVCQEYDDGIMDGSVNASDWELKDLPCRLRLANASNYNGVLQLQNGLHEGVYYWMGTADIDGYFLFYSVLYRSFLLTTGDNWDYVAFCDCKECIDRLDPRECSEEWFMDVSGQFVLQSELSIEDCTETSCVNGYGACANLTAGPTGSPTTAAPTPVNLIVDHTPSPIVSVSFRTCVNYYLVFLFNLMCVFLN